MNFNSIKKITKNKKIIIIIISGEIFWTNILINWSNAITDDVNSIDDANIENEVFVYIENLIVIKPVANLRRKIKNGKITRVFPSVKPTHVDNNDDISVEINGRTLSFGSQQWFGTFSRSTRGKIKTIIAIT